MALNSVSLDTTIQDLHQNGQLSVRATNALKSAGLRTVEDVLTFLGEGGSLLNIRNLGRKSYLETNALFDRIRSIGFKTSVSQEVEGGTRQASVQEQERYNDDYIINFIATCIRELNRTTATGLDYFNHVIPNAEVFWKRIKESHPVIFQVDTTFPFPSNCVFIYSCYLVVNKVVKHLHALNLSSFAHVLDELNIILERFEGEAIEVAVNMVVDTMSLVKQKFLEDYYTTCIKQQSTRTQNIIISQIGDFRQMLGFMLSGKDPLSLKFAGKKSEIEIKTVGEQLFAKTNHIFQEDNDRTIKINSYREIFSFIDEENWKFVEHFYEYNGHLPMFYILSNYLQLSDLRNEKILQKVYGIRCKKENADDVANEMGVSRQTVANITNDVERFFDNRVILDAEYWTRYRFLRENFLTEKTAKYTNINSSEKLDDNIESYLGLCCIIKSYRIFSVGDKYYAVNRDLLNNYNLKKAVSYLSSLDSSKHAEDITEGFYELTTRFQKEYDSRFEADITYALKTIIEENFEAEVDDFEVTFKANKLDLGKEIYRILADANTPLSEQEITKKVKDAYPDEDVPTGAAFSRAVNLSDGILFDRGHKVFFLEEWDDGSYYTGTLIDLIYDVLDRSEEPMSLVEIYSLIISHFPDTTLTSLKSMLSYGRDEKFVWFEDDYFGVANRSYSSKYKLDLSSRKFSFERRFQDFKEFVLTNKRYPMVAKESSEYERSLYRWQNNVMIGNLSVTEDQQCEVKDFVDTYATYPRTYRQACFVDKCHQLMDFIEDHKALPEKKDDAKLWKWFIELSSSDIQDDVVMETALSGLRELVSSILLISGNNDKYNMTTIYKRNKSEVKNV